MKRIAIVTLAVLSLMIASVAFAQGTVPELRGTWKGAAYMGSGAGFKEMQAAYVISDQKGQMFAGYKLYFDNKDVLVQEAFTGIFGDDGNLYFAEKNAGYAFGHRTSKQTMSVYYLEHGARFQSVLYKLERIHFTTGFMEIDRDGDSAIIRAEVKTHYPLNAERIMQEADKNKDGKLTKAEWQAWKNANDLK